MNFKTIINLFKKQRHTPMATLAFACDDYFLLNVDSRVYIKLTEKGYAHLARVRTDEVKNIVPFRAVTVDDIKRIANDKGYTTMRLVDFMMIFGSIINYENGPDYFDPCIRIKSITLFSS